MKNCLPAWLAAALTVVLASSTARADYVDFKSIFPEYHQGSSGSFSTTINGVTVTALPGSNGSLSGNSDTGILAYHSEFGAPPWGYFGGYLEAFSVSFSEPVQIISADILDYHRFQESYCQGSCSAPTLDGTLGSYSVNGGSSTSIVAAGSASGTTHTTGFGYPNTYSYSSVQAGNTADYGNHAGYTFTQNIAQTGTTIDFQPLTWSSVPSGVLFYTRDTEYGVLGINFSRTGSVAVPELNASATTTALALLVGTLALVADRRRSLRLARPRR